MHALPDLVRYEDPVGRDGASPFELVRRLRQRSLGIVPRVQEEVRKPERDALDQYHAASDRRGGDGLGFLDRGPLRGSIPTVARDAPLPS